MRMLLPGSLALIVVVSALLVWRFTGRRKPVQPQATAHTSDNDHAVHNASGEPDGPGRDGPGNRRRPGGLARLMNRRTFFASVTAAIAALAVFAYALAPTGDDSESPRAAGSTTPETQAGADAAPGGPTGSGAPSGPAAEPSPTTVPEGFEFVRLVAPSLGIDAPIVTLGVDQYGTMLSPDNPTDVAWYDFSALPGEGSNVVMAGHLDFAGFGPAVFYNLKNAERGDEMHLVLIDGSLARYRVLDVTTYEEATAPVQEIVGPTDREVVTLITCGGSFDRLSREYDKRVVLRAERIADIAQAN